MHFDVLQGDSPEKCLHQVFQVYPNAIFFNSPLIKSLFAPALPLFLCDLFEFSLQALRRGYYTLVIPINS